MVKVQKIHQYIAYQTTTFITQGSRIRPLIGLLLCFLLAITLQHSLGEITDLEMTLITGYTFPE